MIPTILTAGERAVLVEFDGPTASAAFAHRLRTSAVPQVSDVVPAERTVMVFAATGVTTASLRHILADRLLAGPCADVTAGPGSEVTIGVRYDGADLDDVARRTGLGRAGLIELHTGITWTCSFVGFAPGFGYLTSPDNVLDVPRRPQSRPNVPAGAVALAGKFSAIYPRSSPGGWQLIGTTDTPLWDPDAIPPSLLMAGTRVRFTDLGAR